MKGSLYTRALVLLLVSTSCFGAQRCEQCHPAEVAGFARSAMAHALSRGASEPGGTFVHPSSGTTFTIGADASGMWQEYQRPGESSRQRAAYTIGSGSHAFGYLIQIGDHLFQSPLSYYTRRKTWDVAPGYEQDQHPDFTRPVTIECLSCHSGKALPVKDSLNRYQINPFAAEGITCDRCHGDTENHLKNPVPGSIINPAKLSGAVRDSICEQCHLAGEARVPNPGKAITDFRPGQKLEGTYTIYLAEQPAGSGIKVISQAEQLRLSMCSRKSAGKLWCGSCHDPHDKPSPAKASAYYRARCLTCHGATLDKAHAAPGRDCVGCHMPQQPAKDGGHTAFTDHRITRYPHPENDSLPAGTVTAWREPEASLHNRNLSIALTSLGLQNGSADEVIHGFRLLVPVETQFPKDPAVLTSLGSVLLRAKQPAEALVRFEKARQLRPDYPPYEVNVAAALLALKRFDPAVEHLQRALQMDPLLQQAVDLLATAYRDKGQEDKASLTLQQYRKAMSIAIQ